MDERHQAQPADPQHRRVAGPNPVPQIGFPQMGPVVSMIVANAVPTSADAAAKESSRESFRNRKKMLATPTRTIAVSVQIAAGTWR